MRTNRRRGVMLASGLLLSMALGGLTAWWLIARADALALGSTGSTAHRPSTR